MNIAYFISSHGFGHAARSCAVIRRLLRVGHKVFIYTNTPEWFFKNSLPDLVYEYISYRTDVGLIQKNPFEEDLQRTIQAIKEIFPPNGKNFENLIDGLKKQDVDLVFSDISPLGILAAQAIQRDSILIENFTWDWIYNAYLPKNPDLSKWIEYFKDIFQRVTYHFVTIPYCQASTSSMVIEPISRKARTSRQVVRDQLGILSDERMVLMTMGGIPIDFNSAMFGEIDPRLKIVFPVGNLTRSKIIKNIHLLPHNHNYFHPDLVQAADLVIAKVGYSTISEAYHAGKPLLYLPRATFPESQKLEQFIQTSLQGAVITEDELYSGLWQDKATPLLAVKNKLTHNKINGADQVFDFIQKMNFHSK